ncbi:MAG TPA: DUF4381 family protein [Xanthomonadaceae bacterium]|nr:DUF4381 family protein [Xanthomonadaceae bacterium]
MQATELVLRDIHQPPAPPLWPPAPGWWLIAAGLVAVVALLWWLAARRRRRTRAIARLFDTAIRQAATPAAQVAAMSELLRRAARRHHPQADRLQDTAWLRLLDGDAATPQFTDTDAGRLLVEGPFRDDIDAAAVEPLRVIARQRFVALMGAAKRPPDRATPSPGAIKAAVAADKPQDIPE